MSLADLVAKAQLFVNVRARGCSHLLAARGARVASLVASTRLEFVPGVERAVAALEDSAEAHPLARRTRRRDAVLIFFVAQLRGRALGLANPELAHALLERDVVAAVGTLGARSDTTLLRIACARVETSRDPVPARQICAA